MKHTTVSGGGMRWFFPGVLAVAILGVAVHGALVVRETFAMRYLQETTGQQQSAMAVLYPLYLQLSREVEEIEEADLLAYPEWETLRVGDLPQLSASLEEMVSEHGLVALDIGFQVKAENARRLLLVTLPLRGRYRQLGGVLEGVIELPSLLSIDRLSVVWGEAADEIELIFRLAME